MAKFFTKSNPYFIACGDADASAQGTFTDVYAQYSGASTEDATAAMVLDGNYNNVMLSLENTGANLTDFQMLGQVYRDGPWKTLITGATWGTISGPLKNFVGALNTLASGSSALAYYDLGYLYAVKFQAKIANGVRNVGTFTISTNPTNTKATGTLSVTALANFADGEEVVIGDNTYVFKTALTTPAVANEVLIGVDGNTSLDNLELAIEGGAGAGTLYGTGTVASTEVTASVSGDAMTVTAIARGTGGNSIATTTDAGQASWGDVTLTGGTTETVTIGSTVYTFKHSDNLTDAYDVTIGAAATDSCDNLIAAVNGDAGEGTLYGTDTVAHTQVTAAAGAGDTVVVTTKDGITNAVGTLIATTETCANCAWGATTLADAVMTSITINAQFGKTM